MNTRRRADRSSGVAASGARLLLRQAGQLELARGRHHDLEAKDALLLAYLAIEGPTPRARLATLIWPDADEVRARGNLRQRLMRLKRATGAELVAGNPVAALGAGVAHDLDGAAELLEAVEPPEGGLADWLESQRGRRRRARADALMELAARGEAKGDHASALEHVAESLVLDPHSEEAHRRVMRLHYLRGDIAAAVAAYERCRRTLEHDLGVAPSRETEALRATIGRAGDPATVSAGGRRVPASAMRPPRLIGRDAEWMALQAAWDAGGAAVVLGEAGLGKTRLVTDLARSRHEATAVVSARPGDEHVVYAIATRLLRQLPREARDALDAPVRKELARLLPEFGDADPIRTDAERSRFFNAVSRALDVAQESLAGIVIDDLHFADAASLDLVRYLAADSRLRWVFAARSGEIGPEARALIEAARGATHSAWIELAPLTLAQVTELVESLGIEDLDAARMAPALMRHAGGNPLFTLEAIKAWLTQEQGNAASRLPVSANVASLIQRRIGRLSQDAIRLARCAAVAGQDFSADLACHVLGVRPLDLADAWAELEAAQVFRDGAFAHDLIHEAALASVPLPIARPLHRDVAGFLAEHDGEPASIAAHRLAAGDEVLAIAALEAAAQRCIDAGRLIEGGRHYRRAAEVASGSKQVIDRTFGLYFAAANTLWLSASTIEFNELIEPMRRWARTDGEHCRYWLAEAHRAEREGATEACAAATERAMELAVKGGERELEAVSRMTLGHISHLRGQSEKALHQLSAAADAFRDLREPHNEAAARCSIGSILSKLCRFDEANRQLELAMPWLVEGRYYAYLIANRNARAGNALIAGDARRAVEFLAQARTFAASLDVEAGPRAVTMQRQIEALRRLGRFREALEVFAKARDQFGGETNPDCRAIGLQAVALFLDLGRHDRAEALLAEFERQANVNLADAELAGVYRLRAASASSRSTAARAAVTDQATSPALRCAFAVEVASRKEGPKSMALLERVLAEGRDLGLNAYLPGLWLALAAQRIRQDDRAGALAACDEATEALANFDAEAYRPGLLLRLLELERELGRTDRAEACLKEAVNWIHHAEDVHVPEEFHASFLHRNRANRELLTLARRVG